MPKRRREAAPREAADHPLGHNLYFTANVVARQINKIADRCFAPCGLCPSGALLLHVVAHHGELAPSVAAEILRLAPSSVTRFADALVHRGWLIREPQGRQVLLRITAEGRAQLPRVEECLEDLNRRSSSLVGIQRGRRLADDLFQAADRLHD